MKPQLVDAGTAPVFQDRPDDLHIRTTQPAAAASEQSPTTASQPAWARSKLPNAEPQAMPMNMAVNRTALSRLRAAGSRL